MATLRFLGAAGTVTGSKFLVTGVGGRLLVDCGLYQGERELRRRNWAHQPALDPPPGAVVLTHAHLDHCGWLVRLGSAVRCTARRGRRRSPRSCCVTPPTCRRRTPSSQCGTVTAGTGCRCRCSTPTTRRRRSH